MLLVFPYARFDTAECNKNKQIFKSVAVTHVRRRRLISKFCHKNTSSFNTLFMGIPDNIVDIISYCLKSM